MIADDRSAPRDVVQGSRSEQRKRHLWSDTDNGPAVIGLGSTPSHATNEQQARKQIDAALTAAGWLAR